MKRYLVILAVALGAAACANDYDQFDFGSSQPMDGIDVWPEDEPSDARKSRDSGANDHGEASDGDQAVDERRDADLDAAPEATVEQPDAGDEGTAPGDAGTEEQPTDDGAVDDGSTGDGGSVVDDAGSIDDDAGDGGASTEDVSIGTDGSQGDDASTPDASIGDETSGIDVSTGGDAPIEADADCGPTQKLCGARCVGLDDPGTGCAATSCNPCTLPNAVARCSDGGQCAVDVCAAGFDDCNALPDDGCEVSLATDVSHCGACNRACSNLHTSSRECAGGVCVSRCQIGFANCDRPLYGNDNGCERAVAGDTSNCGSCGNDCHAQGGGLVCGVVPSQCGCVDNAGCRAGSTGSCDMATGRCRCGPSSCQSGETCIPADGPDVCSCNGGRACSDGQTCCQTPSGCRDLHSDPAHCGACGRACPGGFFCSEGGCACNADAQCNAGSAGTCAVGQCVCSGTVCSAGQRCLADGHCG